MRAWLLLLLLGVGACRHGPGAIEIPVALPCIEATRVPPPVPPAGDLPADARQAADLLGAVVLQLRANERLLRALIAPCTRDADVAPLSDRWQSGTEPQPENNGT